MMRGGAVLALRRSRAPRINARACARMAALASAAVLSTGLVLQCLQAAPQPPGCLGALQGCLSAALAAALVLCGPCSASFAS